MEIGLATRINHLDLLADEIVNVCRLLRHQPLGDALEHGADGVELQVRFITSTLLQSKLLQLDGGHCKVGGKTPARNARGFLKIINLILCQKAATEPGIHNLFEQGGRYPTKCPKNNSDVNKKIQSKYLEYSFVVEIDCCSLGGG